MSSPPASADAPHPQQSTLSHNLSRQLNLRDLVLTQILTVVGSSWVGVAAGLGRAQAVVWIAAMIAFYFPMAVCVFYLNREMPLEGGLYVWARTAFGEAPGFMTAWNIWAYGLCVCATILYAIPTELSYLIGPSAAWLPENKPAATAVLAVVLLALTASALRGLALGRWIHNISGIAMLLVFGLLILAPFWSLAHYVPLQYAPLALHLPRANLYSLALMGQMLGALSGLEYVAILAGEARSPARDIGRSVVLSSPIICAMFILGTGAVLSFHQLHPLTSIDFIAPIPQTLRFAFGNHGAGSVLATLAILCVQARLLGATSMIFTGVTRLPMAAGWDHLVPAWFARLSGNNLVPRNSILVSSGIVAALLLFGNIGVHAAEAFQVLSNSAIELYAIAYFAMFAIPLVGAKLLRMRLPWWVPAASALGLLATLFSSVMMAYPFVDVVDPRAYAVKIVGTTVLVNVLGLVFYRARRTAASA